MSDQLDSRVTKLEFRVDNHDKDIAKVGSQTETMGKALDSIKLNLTQIKWVVIGACGAYTLQAVEIRELLKLFFTVLR